MTNREWLDTLSDEEQQKAENKKYKEIIDGRTEEWYTHDGILNMFYEYVYWLSLEHETTADEDFAEIGFEITSESKDRIYYEDTFKREFSILYQGHNVYNQKGAMCFTDGLIDQIRTIADKKRKEVWG